MNRLTERIFESAPHGYFTSQDVVTLFPEGPDTRFGLVKRAISAGEIIHIRRGLYCLAPKYQRRKPNLYALAQHIYGPSYVSLESALSWHGWIPEAVYMLASVSSGRSRQFRTPLGLFSYNRVPQGTFYAAVERLSDENGDVFLMATPLKALTDYVHVNKRDWVGLKPPVDSLRIEAEEFEVVSADDIDALVENYTSRRVRKFLRGLRKDLRL